MWVAFFLFDNMMKAQNENARNVAIDALRGFAVMGIMLLHNIEHFNFYSFPETSGETIKALDTSLWDMMFFTFAGKTYAIFALLFGFTFYLQSRSTEKRGKISETDTCGDFCYSLFSDLLMPHSSRERFLFSMPL